MIDRLAAVDVVLILVPANMTHIFHPLDLAINGTAKMFLRSCFTEHYAAAVKDQLGRGRQLEKIEVDLCLSTVKPLNGRWLIVPYTTT